MSMTMRTDRPLTVQDYLAVGTEAQQLGIRGQFYSAPWSTLETAPGAYNLDPLVGSLAQPLPGTTDVLLGVQVINTSVKEIPADLQAAPFSSADTESRFHALINALKPRFTPAVKYLSIGNEVDAYLSAHPSEWPQYVAFYQDAVAYIHQTLPGVKVGVTITEGGLDGANTSYVNQLIGASDVAVMTYYPTNRQTFVAQAPSAPLTDFPHMISRAQGRPLVLQEVGYPSASTLGSSESQQATFFNNVKTAWRASGSSIPFLNVFALHDLAPNTCSQLAAYYGAYGLPDPNQANFQSFMCTLGSRTADDAPKASWAALLTYAQ